MPADTRNSGGTTLGLLWVGQRRERGRREGEYLLFGRFAVKVDMGVSHG